MRFMVIEKFRNQNADAVYRRLREKGRMMPEGVSFIESWVAQLQEWVAQWSDLIEFEIAPVIAGAQTASTFEAKT